MSKRNDLSAAEQGRPKTFWVILSVIIAFFIWLAAMLAAPEITVRLRHVPINIDVPANIQLEVVSGTDTTTTVVLDGKQYEIGNYTADDIRVVADVSSVTEAGTYEVPLMVAGSSNRSYTITSIIPSTATITFEDQITRTLEIETNIIGLDLSGDYVSPADEIEIDPSLVEITGADSLINKVDRAEVKVEFNRQVTTTQRVTGKILYYDADGNQLDVSVDYFNANEDAVDVTIPVKKVATLPLSISFLNVPENFPIGSLQYTLSQQTLKVAAEESTIRNYSDLVIGYIDFKELNPIRNAHLIFGITLPDGFTNLEQTNEIEVNFDAENLAYTTLNLRNFQTANVPDGYKIKVNDQSLRTSIIGRKTTIPGIASGDFVVKLDFADIDLAAGEFEIPVSIYAPTKGFVWAVGDYSVSVTVTEE